ncbi:MAG: DUF6658 family protein [Halothece sp.]
MKTLLSRLKRIRIKSILTVVFAGLFLFVTTACQGVGATTSKDLRKEIPSEATASPYEGGINAYPDTDPRRDTSAAKAKANELKNLTERQIIDQTGDVGENTKRTLRKKGENLEHWAENAKEDVQGLTQEAKGTTQEVIEGTKRGTGNVKENVGEAAEETGKTVSKNAKRAAEDTADTLEYNAEKATKSTKRALEDVKDTFD